NTGRDRGSAAAALRRDDPCPRPPRAHARRATRRPAHRRASFSRRDGARGLMSGAWRVAGDGFEVSALHEPATSGSTIATFVCAHGAGGNMNDRGIQAVAKELRGRGLDVVRFNFPYTEKKSGRPDPMPVLQACIKAVVAEVDAPRITIGGRSMGGRAA